MISDYSPSVVSCASLSLGPPLARGAAPTAWAVSVSRGVKPEAERRFGARDARRGCFLLTPYRILSYSTKLNRIRIHSTVICIRLYVGYGYASSLSDG